MGNIVGKLFRVVASKDYATALAESVKEGNQAKFYLAQKDGKALDGVTATTDNDRNTLIINGNRIQGVSNNDISKLDAITDVTKLFKYKGSVDTFDDLPTGTLRDISVGDVWNIKSDFTLEGVTYPAYTNVVCVTAVYGSAPMIKWDALGGTMEMGTSVAPTVKDSRLSYKTKNNIPISSFGIVLGSDTGIMADASGVIRIKSDKKTFSRVGDGMLSCISAAPLNHITLHISTDNGLFIGTDIGGNNHIGLRLSTESICYMSTKVVNEHTINNSLSIVSDNNYPLHEFILPCGNGVEAIITDNIKHTANLAVKLSTSGTDAEIAGNSRMSGLDFNGGGLYVALSPSEEVNKKFLIRNGGGLALKYTELVNSLKSDTQLKQYINSLIDAKLQAQ